MSNFDFKKLRQQVKQTNDLLKETFKGTDANLQAINDRGPEWREANQARYKDPNYGKRVGAKIKKTYENPVLRELQRQKTLGYKHTSESLDLIKQARAEQVFDITARKKMSRSATGNQRRTKTIVTPAGIFDSRKLAAEHYLNVLGIKNSMKKIENWLKIDRDNFYYIDEQGNKLPYEHQTRKKK